MTTVVNVQDAKTRLSELLRRVEHGESVVIARAGRQIAELRPLEHVDLVYGRFDITVGDDVFEPLAEAELAAWDGTEREGAA